MAKTKRDRKSKAAKAERSGAPAPDNSCPETVLGEEDAYLLAGLLASPPAPSPGATDAASRYRSAFGA